MEEISTEKQEEVTIEVNVGGNRDNIIPTFPFTITQN